jgi:hypothetical protein
VKEAQRNNIKQQFEKVKEEFEELKEEINKNTSLNDIYAEALDLVQATLGIIPDNSFDFAVECHNYKLKKRKYIEEE